MSSSVLEADGKGWVACSVLWGGVMGFREWGRQGQLGYSQEHTSYGPAAAF